LLTLCIFVYSAISVLYLEKPAWGQFDMIGYR